MSSFENLCIVENFYQTSLGSDSLVQPYYVAGKDYYAMLLCRRNSSNTAQNILRNSKSVLYFVDDKPRAFQRQAGKK